MIKDDFLNSLKHWGEVRPIQDLKGGYRNTVMLVELKGIPYVAKSTRRSQEALEWLEPVHKLANKAGFITPDFLRTPKGDILAKGVTLETFVKGQPSEGEDLLEV